MHTTKKNWFLKNIENSKKKKKKKGMNKNRKHN